MAAQWRKCTLTYYAPSAGGINGRAGGGAAGVPLYDSSWACAAPAQYPFGTVLEFTYGGKTIKVPVLDRGGAIVGSHFDLLVAPADALGMRGAGKVTAMFRVAGKVDIKQGQTQSASFLGDLVNPKNWGLGGGVDPLNVSPDVGPTGPGSDPNKSLGGLPNLGGITDAINGIASAIKDIFTYLTSSKTWTTLGKLILGVIVLIMGLRRMFELAT